METPAPEHLSPILRRHPDGHMEMCCPRCEQWSDAALGFKPLELMAKFKSSLNPVLRCLHCKHTFSPKWLATEEDNELDR